MATEFIITEEMWCDLDLGLKDPPEKINASISKVYSVDGGKPRQLDMCEPHYTTTTLDQLPELLRAYGTDPQAVKVARAAKGGKTTRKKVSEPVQDEEPPKPRRRREEPPKPCPVPGCKKVARGGGGLASHLATHTPAEQRRARAQLAKTTKSFQEALAG